ncbi:MAG: MFS transporter [Acholeplasmataceae bacterium]|nr:MFS transporter [Acholeplasmataceae bacterium]
MKEHKLQLFKFGLYGFLKNLKFFEPFFILFFLEASLSLFLIGILYSIREITIYIFEIPSGVIADKFGKKFELVLCFMFYILSFIIFFISQRFIGFSIGMVLFGFGEAFRSGTHKAMIMSYIDYHQLKESKTKIYGLTRSYSLIGSMFSSIIAVILILYLPNLKYLFVISTIPYILDLILILTYPKYLNERRESTFHLKTFIEANLHGIKYAFTKAKVRYAIFNASSYQAAFKVIKDYIQPLMIGLTLSIGFLISYSSDEQSKIFIGLMYAIIYLLSSFASKYAYTLKRLGDSKKIIRFMWLISGVSILTLTFFIDSLWMIMVVFILLYMMMNARRPIMVEVIGDVTDADQRATVLSIESQSTSILIAIFAPLIGLIADYSLTWMLIVVSISMCVIFILESIYALIERKD